jgi:hypothetical protein
MLPRLRYVIAAVMIAIVPWIILSSGSMTRTQDLSTQGELSGLHGPLLQQVTVSGGDTQQFQALAYARRNSELIRLRELASAPLPAWIAAPAGQVDAEPARQADAPALGAIEGPAESTTTPAAPAQPGPFPETSVSADPAPAGPSASAQTLSVATTAETASVANSAAETVAPSDISTSTTAPAVAPEAAKPVEAAEPADAPQQTASLADVPLPMPRLGQAEPADQRPVLAKRGTRTSPIKRRRVAKVSAAKPAAFSDPFTAIFGGLSP